MKKLVVGVLICFALTACVPGDAGDDDDAPATDEGVHLFTVIDV